MINSKKVKPPKWFYLLGVLIIVAAFAAQIAFTVHTGDHVQYANVPGSTKIALGSAGTYQINYYQNTTDGKKDLITDTSVYADLKYTLTQDSSGQNISITANNTVKDWQTMQFSVSKSGEYTLKADYNGKSSPSAKIVVSLLSSPISTAFTWVFRIIALSGVVMIIATIILRKKNKQREVIQ